jgi:hypothetical protein
LSGAITGTGGTITARAGVLNVQSGVSTGQSFTISTSSASTLEFSSTATTGTAIALSSTNQTLEIGAAGNLTINASESITGGAITMISGSKLTMYGTVSSGATLSGTGTIIAAAGQTLALSGSVSSPIALQIAAGAVLQLGGTVTSGVAFNSTVSGTLDLTNLSAFSGTISGLNVGGSETTATNQIDFGNQSIVSASLNGVVLTVVDSTGQSYTLNLNAAPASGTVVDLKSDGGSGTDLFLSTPATTDTFTIGPSQDYSSDGRTVIRLLGRRRVVESRCCTVDHTSRRNKLKLRS